METNQKTIPGRKATIIVSNELNKMYEYSTSCPNCNAVIFKGNFCSNCGLLVRWVTPKDTLEDRLSELLMFAIHGNADDLSVHMRRRQEETFKLVKECLENGN